MELGTGELSEPLDGVEAGPLREQVGPREISRVKRTKIL